MIGESSRDVADEALVAIARAGDGLELAAGFGVAAILPNPLLFHHGVAPGTETLPKFDELLGLGRGEVVGFGDVVLEVEEHGVGAELRDDLVVAYAGGMLVARTPEKGFVGTPVLFPGEKGQEVDAVEGGGFAVVEGEARGRERGGVAVEAHDGVFVHETGGDPALPMREEGNADAALEHGRFHAAQGAIERRVLWGDTAVVGVKENEGVFLVVEFADLRHDVADGVVHRGEHAGEGATLRVLDVREAGFVIVSGLHGGVHCIEGEVEKPGIVLAALDEGDGFFGKGVGEVGGFFGVNFAVANHGGSAGGIGVEGPGTVVEDVGLVEAALMGAEAFAEADVPLADHESLVAALLEFLGEGGNAPREAEVSGGIGLGPGVGLEAEAVLVHARHEAGTGGRAIGVRRVTVGEAHTDRGEGVEVGGRDVGRVAVGSHVSVAEVVGEDEEDIWRARAEAQRHREINKEDESEGEEKDFHAEIIF